MRTRAYVPSLSVLCLALGAPSGAAAPWLDGPPGGLAAPTVNPQTGVLCYRDIGYVEGDPADSDKHQLDLYLPREDTRRAGKPLVIWIHGGGWVMGDKDDAFGVYGRYCRRLAENGIAAANVSYRLSPRVAHPGHIEDVAAAAAWLIERGAELGFDPRNIFVSGHSAGGHLSALLAVDHRWLEKHGLEKGAIAGAVPVSGVFDLRPLFGLRRGEDSAFNRDTAADASPVLHADAGDPPFVLVVEEHGGFMRSETRSMADALDRASVGCSTVTMADVNHITMMSDLAKPDGLILAATVQLIERVVAMRSPSAASE